MTRRTSTLKLSCSMMLQRACEQMTQDDPMECVITAQDADEAMAVIADNREKWLLDTGATVHVAKDSRLMRKLKSTNRTVTVGSGEEMDANQSGDLMLREPKSNVLLGLKDILVIPSFHQSVISVPRWMEEHDLKVQIDKNRMIFTNRDGKTLIVTKQPEEKLFRITLERVAQAFGEGTVMSGEDGEDKAKKDGDSAGRASQERRKVRSAWTASNAKPKKKPQQKMDINEAHRKFAHRSEDTLRRTFRSYSVELTGKLRPCDGCMRAKAKAKNVKKQTETEAENPGERLFLDTTGPFAPSIGGRVYDGKLVDQQSRKAWTAHLKKKSAIPIVARSKMEELKAKGIHVQFIRCDNAGEQKQPLKTFVRSWSES